MKKFLFIIILSLLITANSNAESFSIALSKAYKNNSELQKTILYTSISISANLLKL